MSLPESELESGFAVTVTLHDALFFVPSVDVTLIVAVPAFFAVTTPFEDTVATAVFEDVHFTVLFAFLPLELTVAFKVSLLPSSNEAVVLFNLTFVTLPETTVTFTFAFFLEFFFDVTVIVALPAFFAVITPLLLTVATFLLDVLYVTFLFAALLGLTVTVVFKVAFLPFVSVTVFLPVNLSTDATFLTVTFLLLLL